MGEPNFFPYPICSCLPRAPACHLLCPTLPRPAAPCPPPPRPSQHDLSSTTNTRLGTPIYMAPEIIFVSKKYDAKVGGEVYKYCEVL